MDNNYFDLDDQITETVDNAWNQQEGVQLPFDHVLFWWKRGDPSVQKDLGSGVRHFGGWAANVDNLFSGAPIIDGNRWIPDVFVEDTFVSSEEGETYQVYTTRRLAVAVIGQRFRWAYRRNPDGSIVKSDRGRGHVQILGLSALPKKDKSYDTWSPVVMSAKGLSAKALQEAISQWEKATAVLRSSEANSIPANFFWLHLGTFGDEIVKQKVGKGNTTNYITPPQLFQPENITVDFLKRVYVGKENAARMAVLAEEAEEWLADWNEQDKNKSGKAQEVPSDHTDNDQDDGYMDDIPF